VIEEDKDGGVSSMNRLIELFKEGPDKFVLELVLYGRDTHITALSNKCYKTASTIDEVLSLTDEDIEHSMDYLKRTFIENYENAKLYPRNPYTWELIE